MTSFAASPGQEASLDGAKLLDKLETGDEQEAALGWNDLAVEIKEYVADLLPRASDRMTLAATNRSTHAAVASLLARDGLIRKARTVESLAELRSILGQEASNRLEAPASQAPFITDLGSSLRARPLAVLASQIRFIPITQRKRAFEMVFEQTQALPRHYRAGPFIALSLQISNLPAKSRQLRYQTLVSAAEKVYLQGDMSEGDYSRLIYEAEGGLVKELASDVGWDDLNHELQEKIAHMLSHPRDRAALAGINVSTRMAMQPLRTRDRVTERARRVTNLGQLLSVLNQTASTGLSSGAPDPVSIAALDRHSRHEPLAALANRIGFMPIRVRIPAFKIVFEQGQALPPQHRGRLFIELSYQIANLPKNDQLGIWRALRAAAKEAHRAGDMTHGEYARFIPQALSLALSDSEVRWQHRQFWRAVERLPRAFRPGPIGQFCEALGASHLSPQCWRESFEDAWKQTQDITDSHKGPALVFLAHEALYLPEEAERSMFFERIFTESNLLTPSDQRPVLTMLSKMVKRLPPDQSLQAFEQILTAIPPQHERHYALLLTKQASNIQCLPIARRSSSMDRVAEFAMHISHQSEKATILTALAMQLSHLPQDARVGQLRKLWVLIAQLTGANKEKAHQVLLTQLTTLTAAERTQMKTLLGS